MIRRIYSTATCYFVFASLWFAGFTAAGLLDVPPLLKPLFASLWLLPAGGLIKLAQEASTRT